MWSSILQASGTFTKGNIVVREMHKMHFTQNLLWLLEQYPQASITNSIHKLPELGMTHLAS